MADQLTRFQRSPDVACRTVDGKTVVVVMSNNSIHSLNASGSWLWEALGEDRFSVDDAAERLAERFGLEQRAALEDADAFVRSLVESGALVGETP